MRFLCYKNNKMKDIISICKPFSMISTERFTTNIQAVIKVENDNIQFQLFLKI